MKKIINGRKYDTDTAAEIGERDNRMAVNDFGYYSETLYRKRTGEYFLYCEGGPASPAAERCYDGWGWGEFIKPLEVAEALSWGEKYLEVDEYEAEFGEVEE